ncbi:hypothetical protein GCM10009668_41310 [Nocardioides dubius]|uniref:Uncharacterized protein n=1 Tax=Nocardioides dubius TaxID=317019 RepID=A0ABP4ELB3_9ACTN
MLTSIPSAISGSSPIVTNSVVPIAKPPMERANTAQPKCAGEVCGSVRPGRAAVEVIKAGTTRPGLAFPE